MLKPVFDVDFVPAAVFNNSFLSVADEAFSIAIERENGFVYRFDTKIISSDIEKSCFYAERLLKMLLWTVGGFKIFIGGNKAVCDYLAACYRPGGIRAFDAKFMSRVYENPFEVIVTDISKVPCKNENFVSIGRHLDGNRIGFDAGGSDIKVSAVVEGKVIYSEEIVWNPKINSSPDYHYRYIRSALEKAAAKMERVDAIGVSSAGVYVNNRAMVASLFIKISDELFDEKIKDIYLNIAKEMGDIPVTVANDGDVAALAGSMYKNRNNVLGIAMGTGEAGGYIDSAGNITNYLNELAFVPVDYDKNASIDEWSGDRGCGSSYFSQDAVIRLAPQAGIILSDKLTPAEKLKEVQFLIEKGQENARKIFETIGVHLGYAVAHYGEVYDIRFLQLMGRVTSGEGGNIIVENAKKVLKTQFPSLHEKITLYMPDEYERRVGQSIAAASLPQIKK
ncbi:MAG: ROK family protein [Firmicutes bacterium]|nr:ROK family protein [Bacillota bacterium]